MHTYRRNDSGSYEVIFDCGADDYAPPVLKGFASEREAAMYVHYLNGGEVPDLFLRGATIKGEIES